MRTLLIQLEGVLAETRAPGLVDNGPIREGLILWHALRSAFEMIVYTYDEEHARYWLDREHITEPLRMYNLIVEEGAVEEMITKARFAGHDISMLVTADPSHVSAAYREGLPGMLIVQPSYGRPEWRPDYKQEPRAWESMVDEVVAKRVALAVDGRTSEHE